MLSSPFRIPEYVSASPNDASTRTDTKEEQTGKRDGCEKPSLAVSLTSLSLTQWRAHKAAAMASSHKSFLQEHKWKPVSENILPLMFTVLPSCFCHQTFSALPTVSGVFIPPSLLSLTERISHLKQSAVSLTRGLTWCQVVQMGRR